MSRRLGRKKALQALFGIEVGETDKDVMISRVTENINLSDDDIYFIRNLVEGVLENKKEIDEKIIHLSQYWDIKRIGKVELCVLRIAAYEILFIEDIPTNVSINEAIELVKIFASEKSAKFVNGILDMIGKVDLSQEK